MPSLLFTKPRTGPTPRCRHDGNTSSKITATTMAAPTAKATIIQRGGYGSELKSLICRPQLGLESPKNGTN